MLSFGKKPSVYHQGGKGPNRVLRFSKSGIKKVRDAHSRHYRWNRSEKKEA
jgi:hypothetical protein